MDMSSSGRRTAVATAEQGIISLLLKYNELLLGLGKSLLACFGHWLLFGYRNSRKNHVGHWLSPMKALT